VEDVMEDEEVVTATEDETVIATEVTAVVEIVTEDATVDEVIVQEAALASNATRRDTVLLSVQAQAVTLVAQEETTAVTGTEVIVHAATSATSSSKATVATETPADSSTFKLVLGKLVLVPCKSVFGVRCYP